MYPPQPAKPERTMRDPTTSTTGTQQRTGGTKPPGEAAAISEESEKKAEPTPKRKTARQAEPKKKEGKHGESHDAGSSDEPIM